MIFFRRCKIFFLIIILLSAICQIASGADDYPYHSECIKKLGTCVDPWEFYYRQCTSYVAWRMNRDAQTTNAPYSFFNKMLADNPADPGRNRWSHAWHWNIHAEDLGITVSSEPVVGAVAQWKIDEISGGYGHVAYVEKIYPDGYVYVSEYNVKKYAYGTRKTKAPRYIYINATEKRKK